MNNNLIYETYIYISSKKLIISVNTNLNNRVYQEELLLTENRKNIKFDKLDFFLNTNIFKIEKKIKNFVEKTNIILDLDVFSPIEISVKKNNYQANVNLKTLGYVLNEAKDYCRKTINGTTIAHMIISNYRFDNKNSSFLPKNIECDIFYLDVKFICISNDIIENLEKILKKYQISLGKVVSANYVREFLSNDQDDIFLMTKEILNGHNPNEVILINKTTRPSGFFEKFFNFFS